MLGPLAQIPTRAELLSLVLGVVVRLSSYPDLAQQTKSKQSAKSLSDLRIRPVFHSQLRRVEAHIFFELLFERDAAAALQAHAPGLTPRAVREEFVRIQRVDVQFPATDGRQLILQSYTKPEADQALLLRD